MVTNGVLPAAMIIWGTAGGGTITGGTASGDDLTLVSTSHATKGTIFFGAALTTQYDEVNDRLGVGTAPVMDFDVVKSVSGGIVRAHVRNSSNTASSTAYFQVSTGGGTAKDPAYSLAITSATIFQMGLDNSDLDSFKVSFDGSEDVGTNPCFIITKLGSVITGSAGALATTATDGYLMISTCAGTPTGVPTAATGKVALHYDVTANKIWVYNGSWRGVLVA